MIVIKLDHFNFKPLRPKDGFGQLLDADDFRLEFNLSSESERRLYLTRQNYYDDRLKILHEYIKFAKQISNRQMASIIYWMGFFYYSMKSTI